MAAVIKLFEKYGCKMITAPSQLPQESLNYWIPTGSMYSTSTANCAN